MWCDKCKGTGFKPDVYGGPVGKELGCVGYLCDRCGGEGRYEKEGDCEMLECPVCHGRKDVVLNKLHNNFQPVHWINFDCPICRGSGRVDPNGLRMRMNYLGREERLKLDLLKLFGG